MVTQKSGIPTTPVGTMDMSTVLTFSTSEYEHSTNPPIISGVSEMVATKDGDINIDTSISTNDSNDFFMMIIVSISCICLCCSVSACVIWRRKYWKKVVTDKVNNTVNVLYPDAKQNSIEQKNVVRWLIHKTQKKS